MMSGPDRAKGKENTSMRLIDSIGALETHRREREQLQRDWGKGWRAVLERRRQGFRLRKGAQTWNCNWQIPLFAETIVDAVIDLPLPSFIRP